MLININLQLDTNKGDKENKVIFESINCIEYLLSNHLKRIKIPKMKQLKTIYELVDFPIKIKKITPVSKPKPILKSKPKTPSPIRRKKS